MMRPITSRAEYMALRDSEQNRRADKRHLVQMNYSCLPTEQGALKGSTLESNSVGMDIDLNSEDWAVEKEKRTVRDQIVAKREELGLLMLEESFSKGYHIVFRRRPDLSQVDNLSWASSLLGVEFDKGAKDVTRVFFTPADKLMYLDDEIFENTAAGRGNTRGARVNAPDGCGNAAQGCVNTLGEGGNTHSVRVNTSAAGLVLDLAGEGKSNTTEGSINKSAANINTEGINGSKATINTFGINTSEPSVNVGNPNLDYLGIPYSDIIKKWFELYNNGALPVKSNRNTLTFELAVNLRHICGFDRQLMARVIPCYDGFPEAEKMACIDSALAEKRTQMPRRLRDVLAMLQAERETEDAANGVETE